MELILPAADGTSRIGMSILIRDNRVTISGRVREHIPI